MDIGRDVLLLIVSIFVASSAFVHGGEVHAGGESERIGVEHWVVGVEEVVVAHAIEDLATVVGCQ